MVDQAQSLRVAEIESTGSLWGQSFLYAVGWAAMGGSVTLTITVVLDAPWWIIPLAGAVCGGAGLYRGSGRLIEHHRELLNTLVNAIELAAQADLNKDGTVGGLKPAPTRMAYRNRAPKPGAKPPTLSEVPAAELDQDDLDDREDFGYFVNEIYVPEGKISRGFTFEKWSKAELPSGRTMSRGLWEDYCARLEECKLARRENPGPRATLIRRATREQALACLAEVIILPDDTST